MKLIKLYNQLEKNINIILNQDVAHKVSVTSIQLDSKKVEKNSAFFAYKGQVKDGNSFINETLDKVSVIFSDKNMQQLQNDFSVNVKKIKQNKIVLIYLPNLHDYLYIFAQNFFQKQKPNLIIAVTGTNGKTSVVEILRQFFAQQGKNVASLGTLGLIINQGKKINQLSEFNTQKQSLETKIQIEKIKRKYSKVNLTSPDIFTFYKIAATLKKNNINVWIFEASSHGLVQKRNQAMCVDIAIFTNLTPEHLDYHKNMKEYLKAKSILFSQLLKKSGTAIINVNSDYSQKLIEICKNKNIKTILYGKKNDMKQKINTEILNIQNYLSKTKFTLDINERKIDLDTKLLGEFNIYNITASLVAFLVAENLYHSFDEVNVTQYVKKLKIVNSRLELQYYNKEKNIYIFVDYAHTPDALLNILTFLQQFKNKYKIFSLFGCGGDRDQSRRKEIAQIVVQIANVVIITDDNPRNENPEKIRNEIQQNITENILVYNVPGREKAIKYLMENIEHNTIAVISGKGHEEYQILQNKVVYFSDKNMIKKYQHLIK